MDVPAPIKVAQYAPDVEASKWVPGDVLLLHEENNLISGIIRWGEALRSKGPSKAYAYFNHCAVVVSTDGDLIEARARGIRRANASEYLVKEYAVASLGKNANTADRQQMVAYCESRLGSRYGWITIMSVIFNIITNGHLVLGTDHSEICSALVSNALCRTSLITPRAPLVMKPSDVAELLGVSKI